jgi:hypothetical protein
MQEVFDCKMLGFISMCWYENQTGLPRRYRKAAVLFGSLEFHSLTSAMNGDTFLPFEFRSLSLFSPVSGAKQAGYREYHTDDGNSSALCLDWNRIVSSQSTTPVCGHLPGKNQMRKD